MSLNILHWWDDGIEFISLVYRVSGLSCPEAGGCKSAILRGFPDVFGLFGPVTVVKILFRYSWTPGMKKGWNEKKGQLSGVRVGSN